MVNSYFFSRSIAPVGAILLSVVMVTSASAATLDDQLKLCAQQTSDLARLACFDELAASVTAIAVPVEDARDDSADVAVAEAATEATVVVDPSTGVPRTPDKAGTQSKNKDTFGTAEEQKQSIRVMIEKTKRNARGDWYFYFDNGEVWKQIDSRTRRIPPLPVAATVSRGIFSSHKLHIDGEVWSMKIRRLK